MNRKYIVELSEEEKQELVDYCKKGMVNVRKYKRAAILLKADRCRYTTEQICEAVQVSSSTVFRVKRQFVEENLAAALNEGARSGAMRKTSAKDEATLIATACTKPPTGHARWTLSLLGERLVTLTDLDSISYETIRRRLKENALKPWQKKMWCVATMDAEYIARMEHVLELYAEPADELNPIINFDEAMKQLVDDTRPAQPMKPGQTKRLDYEYKRVGVANLFVFFDRHRGWRHVKATERKTKIDFANCMRDLVDLHYPHANKIKVVLDNLSTHTEGALYKAFSPQEARRILNKLELHYTPKHASWLNMVEIEIGNMNKQCLDRRIASMEELKTELAAWEWSRNKERTSINWLFNVELAREKLQRAYGALN